MLEGLCNKHLFANTKLCITLSDEVVALRQVLFSFHLSCQALVGLNSLVKRHQKLSLGLLFERALGSISYWIKGPLRLIIQG